MADETENQPAEPEEGTVEAPDTAPEVAVETEEKPFIYVQGFAGLPFKLDLPLHEALADQLTKGYLRRVANLDGDPYVPEEESPEVAALPEERPALNANKKTWVGWAVKNGMTPDDAEALTKTDLIEKFGTDN
ncbi:hypothetical protein [Microbacterium sp. PM5]|uniref:hypothetical protein n=1 Tax=Microbacterium sp. PM5 TaxID=2014534 RepID=UPI0019551BA9|nr:hypothetical protein [Microbacterium sp. PM5]